MLFYIGLKPMQWEGGGRTGEEERGGGKERGPSEATRGQLRLLCCCRARSKAKGGWMEGRRARGREDCWRLLVAFGGLARPLCCCRARWKAGGAPSLSLSKLGLQLLFLFFFFFFNFGFIRWSWQHHCELVLSFPFFHAPNQHLGEPCDSHIFS